MTVRSPPGAVNDVRRPLTTVFIDVVASTPLSVVMDDEDYNDMLAEYRRISFEVIERYGGFVPKDEGDGRFVWFGWPIARRDDAQRAVEMSVELLDALGAVSAAVEQTSGSGVDVRIGIHSGSAIVSNGVVPASADVNGATVNFAAKVQAAAEPGSVLITEATEQSLTDGIELATAGSLSIDPLPGEVALYRVIGPHADSKPAGPFVGRDAHLDRLISAADIAHAGGSSAITLVGPAGIGKSRLSAEFRQQRSWSRTLLIGGDERLIDVPMGALDAFMTRLGVERETLGSASDAARSLIDAIATTTKAGPVLVVVEDLQWLDPSSREVLIALTTEQLPGLMVLMLTRRVPIEPGWADLEILGVDPLADSDARELVAAAAPQLSSDDAASLIERASGNPFFLVWLGRSTSDDDYSGVRRILRPRSGVPAVVQIAVRSQIDEAAVDDEITTCAATIGMEFRADVLATALDLEDRVLGEALDALQRHEIIRAGDRQQTYRFTHGLVRELAYDLLLGPARATSHAKVAGALEALLPDEHTQLGLHWDLAGRPHEACEHKFAAAKACRRTNAFREATTLLDRVLELVEHAIDGMDELAYDAKALHASLTASVGPKPYIDGTNATTGLLDPFDTKDVLGRHEAAQYAMGSVRDWAAAQTSGNLPEAMRLLYRVRQIAKSVYPTIEPYNRNARALFAAQRGHWAHAEHLFQRSIDQMTNDGLDHWLAEHWGTTDDPIAVGTAWAAPTFFQRGNWSAARAALDRSQRRAESVEGGGQSIAHVASHHASFWELTGDGERAAEIGRQITEIATELELWFWAANGEVHQRLGLAITDPTPSALDAVEADAALVASVAPLIAARQYVQLAELAIETGDAARAGRALDVLRDTSRRTGMRCYDAEETRLRAVVDREERLPMLLEAVTIARRQGATRFHLRALTDLAGVAPATPLASRTAHDELCDAIADFPEPDGDADVDRAAAVAGAIG